MQVLLLQVFKYIIYVMLAITNLSDKSLVQVCSSLGHCKVPDFRPFYCQISFYIDKMVCTILTDEGSVQYHEIEFQRKLLVNYVEVTRHSTLKKSLFLTKPICEIVFRSLLHLGLFIVVLTLDLTKLSSFVLFFKLASLVFCY